MIIECGRRFWEDGGWARCVLDRKHSSCCQSRIDTVEEVLQAGRAAQFGTVRGSQC